ncbi:MAG TPA: DUF1302 domain-containing protein [Usitatibacter sp.]|nr:DUF1302 domain-containing protein [Usitatibacter sp.]
MRPAFRLAARPLALALALLGAAPVHALQFSWDNGIDMNLDTTISYGVSVRTENPDPSLIGIVNGGTSRSPNEDNGDLNFKKNRPFANLVKATSDLEIKYKNFGFFGRGTAYYDFDLHDSDKLGPTGRDRLGQDVIGLDGFVYGAFEPAGHNLRVRIGRQVISWGESTFIPGGINVINPVDLSLLRSPGAELKEAFIPTAGIWSSFELTKAASVEGFYLSNFDKIRIDPKGSFFSNNDFVSDDADRLFLSYGRRRDDLSPPTNPVPPGIPVISATAQALYGPYDPAAALWIPRQADKNPSDWGQYGVALRYFATNLNDTEFGFYFMNYHSRTPFVSGMKGTMSSVLTGGPLVEPICSTPALVALCTSGTARYFAEYPENIRLFGWSFNTSGPYGIALQGEYSYRPNQPVQLSGPEVTLATLGLPNLITGYTQIPGAPAGATAAALVPDGTYIQGYQRAKMSQLQLTGTKSWPNVMKADQLIVVGEVGATYFHNLPSDQKFAAPAVYLPATQFGSIVSQAYSVQPGGFLTNFSWGYRLLGRLEYSNLLFNGNVAPRIAFGHDVNGEGPVFNEDTKSLSVGASWEYQQKWVVDAQYTTYWGGKTYCGTDQPPPGSSVTPGQPASWCSSANPLKDRDFYSVSVSYSF